MELIAKGSNQTVLRFDDGREVFFSYSTPVAGFLPGVGHFRTEQRYSITTTRHINKYLDGVRAVNASPAEIQAIVDGKHNAEMEG